jgi:hypothetical protein
VMDIYSVARKGGGNGESEIGGAPSWRRYVV